MNFIKANLLVQTVCLIMLLMSTETVCQVLWRSIPDIFFVGHVTIFTNAHKTNNSGPMSFTTAHDTRYKFGSTYAIGLTDFEAQAFSSIGYRFEVQTTTDNITFKVFISGQGLLTALKVDYLRTSYLDSYLIIQLFDKQLETGSTLSKVKPGGGLRSSNVSQEITNRWLGFHQVQLTMYIHDLQMFNANGSYFYLNWNKYLNRTHFTIQLITEGQTTITNLKFKLLAVDKNWIRQRNYYVTAQMKQFIWSSYSDTTTETINDLIVPEQKYIGKDRQFYGISGFNITKRRSVKMLIDTEAIELGNGSAHAFSLSQSISFLKISSFNIAGPYCQNNYYYNGESKICVTSCNTGYYSGRYNYLFCRACYYSCRTCSSYSFCTSCPATRNHISNNKCQCKPGYFDIPYSNQCFLCSDYIPGCNQCTTYNKCTECNTTGSLQLSIDKSKCQCADPTQIMNQDGVCISHFVGCLVTISEDNSDKMKCIQCNLTANFTMSVENDSQCVCKKGSYLKMPQIETAQGIMKQSAAAAYCEYMCGDGIYSDNEGCDDGNLVDKDGCSANCLIQPEFVCFGLLGDTSYCTLNKSTALTFLGALRQGHNNSVVLYFSLKPSHDNFQKISNGDESDQNKYLSSIIDFDTGQIKYDDESLKYSLVYLKQNEKNAFLTITFNYLANIDPGEMHSLKIRLTQTKLFGQDTNTENFKLSGKNYELTFDEEDFLSGIQDIVVLAFVIAYFGICFLSIFSERMVGAQLMHYSQMLYFYLFFMTRFKRCLITVRKNLNYMNGYGQGTVGFNGIDLANGNYSAKLLAMLYSKDFIDNFNYMALVFLLPIVMVLCRLCYPFIHHELEKRRQRQRRQRNPDALAPGFRSSNIIYPFVLKWQFIIGRVLILTTSVFSPQILFSIFLSFMPNSTVPSHQNSLLTSSSHSAEFLQTIAFSLLGFACLILILIVWALVFFKYIQQRNQHLQDQKRMRFLQFENFDSSYMLLWFCWVFGKIFIIGLFLFEDEYPAYILLSLEVLYLIRFGLTRPYKHQEPITNQNDWQREVIRPKKFCYSLHNAHNIVNSVGSIVFLIAIIIANNTNKVTQQSQSVASAQWIYKFMVIWIMVTLFINFGLAFIRVFFSEKLARSACVMTKEQAQQQNMRELQQRKQKQIQKRNKRKKLRAQRQQERKRKADQIKKKQQSDQKKKVQAEQENPLQRKTTTVFQEEDGSNISVKRNNSAAYGKETRGKSPQKQGTAKKRTLSSSPNKTIQLAKMENMSKKEVLQRQQQYYQEKNTSKKEREKGRDREREINREREREREGNRERNRERETEKKRNREKEKEREKQLINSKTKEVRKAKVRVKM